MIYDKSPQVETTAITVTDMAAQQGDNLKHGDREVKAARGYTTGTTGTAVTPVAGNLNAETPLAKFRESSSPPMSGQTPGPGVDVAIHWHSGKNPEMPVEATQVAPSVG